MNKENEENLNVVNNFFDEKLNQLKIAVNQKKVVKGMKEVMRAIERKRVKRLYLAKNDNLDGDYSQILKDLADQNGIKDVIMIKDYVILRDIVINGSISSIDKLRNKKIKGPKCFSAAELI